MAWVLMVTDVKPGPSIEGTIAHPRNIVRNEIISQTIALIGRAPHVSGCGMDRKADAVADARSKDAWILSVGIESQHRCAIGLVAPTRAQRMLTAPPLQASRRSTHPLRIIARRAHR